MLLLGCNLLVWPAGHRMRDLSSEAWKTFQMQLRRTFAMCRSRNAALTTTGI